jgi:hypothetical protein
LSFKDDVSIDRHSLDLEWLKQAQLFNKYSEACANAIYERDKAKERMDLTKAQVEFDIRNDFDSYGLESKPTEGAIASLSIQDVRNIEARESLLLAQRDLNIITGTKVAMEHKKTALEVLSKLYLSGYWAEVRVSSEARKKYGEDDYEEEVKEALNANPRIRRR